MARAFAEIAFTKTVRDIQSHHGSAKSYAKFLTPEAASGDKLGEMEKAFILARDGFYQATISETGWPYVQFRGGPKGFLKVIDDKTVAYADFRGNRQYISAGNLTENAKISLILMDYPNRRRLKLWGHAKLVSIDTDAALVSSLHSDTYAAKPERAVIITIDALDWNCPQHIPQRLTVAEMAPQLEGLHQQIAQLQDENQRLKAQLGA